MIKWFEIHDISNLTQGKYQRLANKVPFHSSADVRLKWLQDFLKWLIDWEKSTTDKKHFLTAETFAAIVITTKSTIAKISYLLDTAGFKFVLTRKFNSDNLERKFRASEFRQKFRQTEETTTWKQKRPFTGWKNCCERE